MQGQKEEATFKIFCLQNLYGTKLIAIHPARSLSDAFYK